VSMRVVHSPREWLAQLRATQTAAIATVGNFDGVHRGHQKILRGVVERARQMEAVAAAVTFDPHPLKVLRPAEAPPLVVTLDQRLALLEATGLDAALVLRFDMALAILSPEEFVRRILVETMGVRAVLVGQNFRFGHKQAGDTRRLKELGELHHFEVQCVEPVVLRGVVVSSSAVRQAVRDGQVTRAGRWLGRPFALCGDIKKGTGMGRRLVVPTLNLAAKQELLPGIGVYATETLVAGKLYRSATNVGFRPTFDGTALSIESHLFDFSQELASGPMEVRFWCRLRDERKFSGPEALRTQIGLDLERAQSFFRRFDRTRRPRQLA
jgi:riboflavin kinase/FMN adenylyltransferase